MRRVLFAAVCAASGTVAKLFDSSVTEWFWQNGVAVGDYLYIGAGESYAPINGTSYTSLLNTYAAVSLTTSWTNQTVTAEAWTYLNERMQFVRQPLLFYDPVADRINEYGGWPYDSLNFTYDLWSFQPANSTPWWYESTSPTASGIPSGHHAPFAAAYAQSDSDFFTFGGHIWTDYNHDSMTFVAGLTRYNFATKEWSNDDVKIPHQSGYLTQAQMSFAPNFGKAGYLVVVGGRVAGNQQTTYETGTTFVDMSVITLYDVATKTWYSQTATGDVPPPRAEFCSVAKASGDNKTFEMFIYGGATNTTYDLDNPNEDGYLSVYALSLPAFRWFKTNSTTSVRRAAHRCTIIGQSQMVSMGGRLPSTLQALGAENDPWAGLGIFDLNSFSWADHYDAAASAYDRVERVGDYYSSRYTEPTWSNSALASTFAFQSLPSTGTGPNSSSTSSTSKHPHHSGLGGGAIAGIVIGVILGVLIVVGLVVFCMRSQRRKRGAATVQTRKEGASELEYMRVPEAGSALKYEVEGDPAPYVKYKDTASHSHGSAPQLRVELPGDERYRDHEPNLAPHAK